MNKRLTKWRISSFFIDIILLNIALFCFGWKVCILVIVVSIWSFIDGMERAREIYEGL